MTLNARQSPEDSLRKIRTDNNWAIFWEHKQISEKFDRETSKLQPVSLSDTSSNTASVHQRATDSLQSFLMFLRFVRTRPLKCNDRLINGLFHSKCLDFSYKWKKNYFETSIIWIRRLQRQDKPLFKINHAFDKDQMTRFIRWLQKHFWFNCLFYESIYDLLNIPKRDAVSTYRLIANPCKIKCFWI